MGTAFRPPSCTRKTWSSSAVCICFSFRTMSSQILRRLCLCVPPVSGFILKEGRRSNRQGRPQHQQSHQQQYRRQRLRATGGRACCVEDFVLGNPPYFISGGISEGIRRERVCYMVRESLTGFWRMKAFSGRLVVGRAAWSRVRPSLRPRGGEPLKMFASVDCLSEAIAGGILPVLLLLLSHGSPFLASSARGYKIRGSDGTPEGRK